MTYSKLLSASAFALVLGMVQPSLAAPPFVCPTQPIDAAQAARVKAMLPSGDAYDQVGALNTAVTTLKAEGVNPVIVVDSLISAYCPTVAEQTGLTDAQKTERVRRFAARIVRTVYAIDSADAIFLDVSFPPLVVDAINAKARAVGVSPEDWIRTVVNSALK